VISDNILHGLAPREAHILNDNGINFSFAQKNGQFIALVLNDQVRPLLSMLVANCRIGRKSRGNIECNNRAQVRVLMQELLGADLEIS
jgi:hypothetical protein